jgi:hypothetical protein
VGWFDDIADFVGDVADVVSDPIGTITDVVSDPVGAITDAVNSVSNVVEGVAPLGGLIGTVIGGPIGGAIGNVAGDILGGGGGDGGGGPFGFVSGILDSVTDIVPDGLMDVATDLIGGGSLIGAAGDLLGGGLGDVGSGLLGTIGDVVPGLSEAGGFLGGLGDLAGGDVLSTVAGGLGIPTDILDTVSHTIGDVVGAAGGLAGQVQDAVGGEDSALGFLDDLLPDSVTGALDEPGKLLEGLGQIAQTGGLGEALASLSTDDLSALVTKLVTPVSPAAAAAAADDMMTSPGIVDPSTLPGADDDFTFDITPTNTGIVPPDLLGDDDLLGTGAAAASADDGSMATMDSGDLAGTSGPADMDSSGGFSDDVFTSDVSMDAPAPDVAPAPAPEPEPESDFSQAIQSADAVDQSFDSMFEDLG